jgi:hypothetical protein
VTKRRSDLPKIGMFGTRHSNEKSHPSPRGCPLGR